MKRCFKGQGRTGCNKRGREAAACHGCKARREFPLLRERFLSKLVTGVLPEEEVKRRKDYFGWKDLGKYYQVIVLAVPDGWDELETVKFTELIKSEMGDEDEIFSNREEDLTILLQGESEDELYSKTKRLVRYAFRFSSDRKVKGSPEVLAK